MQYGFISSRDDATSSITNAMKKHCISKNKHDSPTLTNDTPKRQATNLVNYAFRYLDVKETGEVECTKCATQLLPSNHAKIEAFSERCVKLIQHTIYSIGCILTEQPRISTTQKSHIYCYPDMALDKDRFEKLKGRLFDCNLRIEEQTQDEKKDEQVMVQIAIDTHHLFYRELTINGNIVHEYGCIKCGIIIDDRLAEQLFYALVPNGRYLGNYLNKCSPKCHPYDHRILVEDSPYSLDGFHSLVPGLVSLNVDPIGRLHGNPIGNVLESDHTLIDNLFDHNFNQSTVPLTDILRLQFKRIFRAQFHSKNADERQEILSHPMDTSFSEEMSALCLEIQETGAIPGIYTPAALTPKSSLCITSACKQAETKATIAFSPCGHVLLCNACWRTHLSILKDSGCTKRNCSKQITEYLSLENHKNYDLDGIEIRDPEAYRNTCVKCNVFITPYDPVYLHFSKEPALEEGATASPSSFDEALDETKGACALPLYEDNPDHVQKERVAQHPLCERCGHTSLKRKIENKIYFEGACPAWQQCGFSESEKATYIRILT